MASGQESLATDHGLQSETGALRCIWREGEEFLNLLLPAVFPRGIVYDERHYGPAIRGFDDF